MHKQETKEERFERLLQEQVAEVAQHDRDEVMGLIEFLMNQRIAPEKKGNRIAQFTGLIKFLRNAGQRYDATVSDGDNEHDMRFAQRTLCGLLIQAEAIHNDVGGFVWQDRQTWANTVHKLRNIGRPKPKQLTHDERIAKQAEAAHRRQARSVGPKGVNPGPATYSSGKTKNARKRAKVTA